MKKIVPVLFLKDKKAYSDKACLSLIDEKLTPVQICLRLEAAGADELFIMDLSYDDASHDGAISIIREIGRETDLPLNVGGNIKRVEDVKNTCTQEEEELFSMPRLRRTPPCLPRSPTDSEARR